MRACVFVIIIISAIERRVRRSWDKIFRRNRFYSYAKRWIKLYIFTHGNVVICKFISLIHTQTSNNISLGCFNLNSTFSSIFFSSSFFPLLLLSHFLCGRSRRHRFWSFMCFSQDSHLGGESEREKEKGQVFRIRNRRFYQKKKKSCFSFNQLRYQPKMVLLTNLVIFFSFNRLPCHCFSASVA